jgi:hypothetical protein
VDQGLEDAPAEWADRDATNVTKNKNKIENAAVE